MTFLYVKLSKDMNISKPQYDLKQHNRMQLGAGFALAIAISLALWFAIIELIF